jgi:hypothetical protein
MNWRNNIRGFQNCARMIESVRGVDVTRVIVSYYSFMCCLVRASEIGGGRRRIICRRPKWGRSDLSRLLLGECIPLFLLWIEMKNFFWSHDHMRFTWVFDRGLLDCLNLLNFAFSRAGNL